MIEEHFDIRFVARLALREKQIQQNYRPIIAVHKWFARRPGTLFRSLVLSEFKPQPISHTYYRAHDFPNKTVGDPFMGGGTPILEANRVGCDVVATDINPMATWIVHEEIDSLDLTAYQKTANQLLAYLEDDIGKYYRTRCPVSGRNDAQVKYFLWVKTGRCTNCSKDFDLFPGFVLAEDARHPVHVVVCHQCGELRDVKNLEQPGTCVCGATVQIEGRVKRNRCSCPHCGAVNTAPFHGEGPPTHRMFAMEYHNDQLQGRPGRLFKAPDHEDLALFEELHARWTKMRPSFVPKDVIPDGDETKRLHRWGYNRFSELFNARQRLALEVTARFISKIRDNRLRQAFATNFSDLLRYQNMLCRYDTSALKSLDVFSIHGFPVGYVQAESNFLGIRSAAKLPVGSGGWINIIDKYAKAKAYCDSPFEVAFEGKSKSIVPIRGEWIGRTQASQPGDRARSVDIRCASATETLWESESLDAVFTDPPYYGMVQYGELMQFCYVWLRRLMGKDHPHLGLETTCNAAELTGNDTAARGIQQFAEGLATVYTRVAAALKPGAPLAFTFHHNKQEAYLAAAMAILDAGLTCSASLPCPAEMGGSIHIHGTASSIVDTVFVCRRHGSTRKKWLFDDAKGLTAIMVEELASLSAAGMKPSGGDIRCIAFGHIARMAIWKLRGAWNVNRPTATKLAAIRTMMDSIATVEDLQSRLKPLAIVQPEVDTGLFAKQSGREPIDVVAF